MVHAGAVVKRTHGIRGRCAKNAPRAARLRMRESVASPAAPAPGRVALVALVALVAAGCAREGDGGAVVELWAMGREGEVVQQLVPAFEQRTPGVHVRVQQIPWSAAHEKLLTAYVGEAMPDMMQLGNTWLPEFVALGAVAPLDDRVAASTIVHPDAYPAGVLDPNVLDGVTYAIPWYVDTRVLFYRADLLRAAGRPDPPATWDDWLVTMTRLKARAGADAYAILLPMNEWQMPAILALQRGAALLRDRDRYGNFTSAPVREAFAFYLDLFHRDLAPRAGEAQVANVYQDFAHGYFALYVTGPWNLGEFARRLPPELADDWTTAPLPGPDAAHPGVSLAGGASLAVARRSPHAEAAWRFIEYLSEPAQQVALYRLAGDLPARSAAWDDPLLRDDRRARAFATQLRHVRSTPKVPEWERIASVIGEHLEAAIRGRATLDEALAALDGDVDAILEKRRWMMDRAERHDAH
jgi:multiple sugar transport system substrate-binding protein